MALSACMQADAVDEKEVTTVQSSLSAFNGQGWNGQGWNGQGWNGQGWNGQGWNGIAIVAF